MDIGNDMRGSRMKVGLTQAEAAKQIGVSRQTLSNWENERTYADIAQLMIMSHVYGLSVDELISENVTILEPPQKTASPIPNWLQFTNKCMPLVLYTIAVIVLCSLTWYTEVYNRQGQYVPGYYTVLWIYSYLPIITIFITQWVTSSSLWGKGRWLAVAVIQLVQIGIQYFCLYRASLFHYMQSDRPIDFIGIWKETIGVSVLASFLGIGIGLLIRYVKPKIMRWLSGLD